MRNGQCPSQCVILTHSVLLCLSHLWAQVSQSVVVPVSMNMPSSLDFKELPSKRISILVVKPFLVVLWPDEIMKLMEEELLCKEEKRSCNKDLKLEIICEAVNLSPELY